MCPSRLLCCALALLAKFAAGDVNVTVLVVGKVSTHDASVLLELNGGSGEVAALCEAAPSQVLRLRQTSPPQSLHAVTHGVNCSALAARRPVVFFFESLPAATAFDVILPESVGNGSASGSLRTFDPQLDDLTLGVVSCNKHSLYVEEASQTGHDLWEPLSQMVRDGRVQGVLHTGDQVYVDDDRFQILGGKDPSNGRTAEQIKATCAFCRAEDTLKGLPPSSWDAHAEDIRESFRDTYRWTWGHGPTARVLANTMNLFVIDDHALVDDVGDRAEHRNQSSMVFFLAQLAFEVAWEYQYQAMGPWDAPLSRAYYTHVIGDAVGIMLLDVRAERSVLASETQLAGDEARLGTRQWEFMRSAVAASGVLAEPRLLVVVSPLPLAYVSETGNALLAAQVDDFLGAWPAFPEEQTAVVRLLEGWRSGRSGRRVVVASGDVHHGGHSAFFGESVEAGPKFTQITASAIQNRELSLAHDVIINGLLQSSECALGFKYRHRGWTRFRNFGAISAQHLSRGGPEPPEVVQTLYVNDGAGGARVHSTLNDNATFDEALIGCDIETLAPTAQPQPPPTAPSAEVAGNCASSLLGGAWTLPLLLASLSCRSA